MIEDLTKVESNKWSKVARSRLALEVNEEQEWWRVWERKLGLWAGEVWIAPAAPRY